MKKTWIAVLIIVAVLAGLVAYRADRALDPDEPIPGVCTMEARMCPDGSAVGRVGPNCEFEPCPSPRY